MKKLLLLLLCVPLIGFGQDCNYGGTHDASELCRFIQGDEFASDRNADIALGKILSVTGFRNFALKQCSDISNCVATSYKGIRYILYDQDFMDIIATETNSWSNLSILAHEIGHHVNGHSLDLIVYASEIVEPPTLSESRENELEADEYSGFVMYKLGATLYQAQEAVRFLSTNEDDTYSTHPKLDKRLAAIERGYNNAKGKGSNNDYSTNSSTLTAEDYFYKAYNNKSDYQYKIDNYTKYLRICPDCSPAIVYSNRGIAYANLGNYKDAISDYTDAIRIDSDFSDAYYNRALMYTRLGHYEDAISDYTDAIRIDSDYTDAYCNRGYIYDELGNYEDAISDYTDAIRIDSNYAIGYYNRALTYVNLGHYEDAIFDCSSVIRIDPDYAKAYQNRGILKKYKGLPYCSDYKRACDLGVEEICESYNDQCR
jgi:tetratricopeptide (TPR) repeat protein